MLELWAAIVVNGDFLTALVFEERPFKRQFGVRWLEIRFRMNTSPSSYLEARAFDHGGKEREFKPLLFCSNNRVDEFGIRVYSTEAEALGAREDFARQVEPARYQGQNSP